MCGKENHDAVLNFVSSDRLQGRLCYDKFLYAYKIFSQTYILHGSCLWFVFAENKEVLSFAI
jgi:hypothetical protein